MIKALLVHPRLALWLVLLCTLLTLPSLWLGFHLDDHVHRYLYSGLPGSAELLHAYQSPFGIANGDPATNHWQIEKGYAPWWIHPQLLISLFRPLSAFTHQLDAWFWPASAVLAHAHSLLWHALLVLCVTLLYRNVMGITTAAGLAAVLYAFDYSHGFAVGWIANRNALIAAALGSLALLCHVRAERQRSRSCAVLAPCLLGAALLAGEAAVSIFGYVLGYALFVDRRSKAHRLLSLLPHAVVLVSWRIAYQKLGRGALFSGLYVDPLREPLHFASATLERLPLLVLGQFGLPPAESVMFMTPPLAITLWCLALGVTLWLLIAFWPLLRADRQARFWAFGMLAALIAACSTHPHNRLLFFVGIGAFALLSSLWHGLRQQAAWLGSGRLWQQSARLLAALCVGFHLLLSPLLLPLTACSIALTSPAEAAARSLVAAGSGRDVIVVSAPDYFYVKLAPVLAALERRPPPRRLRALSFGPVPLRIERVDAHSLRVRFKGGLLASALLELYRKREATMLIGTTVALDGLRIEVTALTSDGLVAEALFVFDTALDDPQFIFLTWDGTAFAPFAVPPVGTHTNLPAASLHFRVHSSAAPPSSSSMAPASSQSCSSEKS